MSSAQLTVVAHLDLPADARYLAVARLALAGVASQIEMADAVLEDLKFAVSEAIANAIKHGYGEDPGTVELDIAVSPAEIELTVRDQGCGFDTALATSGIGLRTMRALCARFEIESARGAGTRVTLARALPA